MATTAPTRRHSRLRSTSRLLLESVDFIGSQQLRCACRACPRPWRGRRNRLDLQAIAQALCPQQASKSSRRTAVGGVRRASLLLDAPRCCVLPLVAELDRPRVHSSSGRSAERVLRAERLSSPVRSASLRWHFRFTRRVARTLAHDELSSVGVPVVVQGTRDFRDRSEVTSAIA